MLARTTPLSITNLMLADSGCISSTGGALVTSPRSRSTRARRGHRHVHLYEILEHFLNDVGGWTCNFYLRVPLLHPDLPSIHLVGHGAIAQFNWLLTVPRRMSSGAPLSSQLIIR